MAGPDSDRLYISIDRLNDTITRNHTEVVQRLSKLEEKAHRPTECRGVITLQREFDDYKVSVLSERKDEAWKGIAKEGLRYLATIASFFGIMQVGK